MMAAQSRFVARLHQLCSQHKDEIIAVISHSDLIKAVLAHYAGIHLDMMQRLEVEPASVSIVEIFPETARIRLVNDTGLVR
jgi:probable phosphoglycerate mutase